MGSQGTHVDIATRWFEGLINKDVEITNEVYSIHDIEFDRQVSKCYLSQLCPQSIKFSYSCMTTVWLESDGLCVIFYLGVLKRGGSSKLIRGFRYIFP